MQRNEHYMNFLEVSTLTNCHYKTKTILLMNIQHIRTNKLFIKSLFNKT